MKLLRLAAIAAAVSLAACTQPPTGSVPTDTSSPSFDGGNGLGSANYAGEEGSSGSSTVTSDTTTTTERGGNTLGSGH